jgi:3-deoxy-7-phosphoheptulonate synthase
MVDASHGNSAKDPRRQIEVVRCLATQVSAGSRAVFGVMIESFLVEGRQTLKAGRRPIFGQSITDACLGWEDTAALLSQLARAVRSRRRRRARRCSTRARGASRRVSVGREGCGEFGGTPRGGRGSANR